MGWKFQEFIGHHKADILLMQKSRGTRGLDFDTAEDGFNYGGYL
jgi:hypothetical protein